MDGSLILFNILNPPVLFFFLGMLAVFFKSDLEIPQPLPKLFSLYLLMAIGFKGGYELAKSGIIDILAAVKRTAIPHHATFLEWSRNPLLSVVKVQFLAWLSLFPL